MSPTTESPANEEQITLAITGMTCANCAATIQRTLEKKVAGVVEARVNFASEKAQVVYLPDQVGPHDLVEAIEKVGYSAVEPGPDVLEDSEGAARQAEIQALARKFWIGLSFSLPLFLLSMSRDFGFLGA